MLGYRVALRDHVYVAFLAISMAMLVAYQQLYSTLSVFLRDWRGVPARGYGLLLSINAGTVVLLQFWVTRRTKRFPPALMMALGSVLYLVGLSMYGFVSAYTLFALAMVLITVGEMIVVPVGQSLAASLAPEDMRGRYMAIYGLSWAIPSAIAPWAGGLILDNYNPNWLWYAAGIACAVAAAGFVALHLKTAPRHKPVAEEAA